MVRKARKATLYIVTSCSHKTLLVLGLEQRELEFLRSGHPAAGSSAGRKQSGTGGSCEGCFVGRCACALGGTFCSSAHRLGALCLVCFLALRFVKSARRALVLRLQSCSVHTLMGVAIECVCVCACVRAARVCVSMCVCVLRSQSWDFNDYLLGMYYVSVPAQW